MADSASKGKTQPENAEVRDKYIWTLIRPVGVRCDEFQHYVLSDLAKAAGEQLPGANSVRVTLQEPHAFSGAFVHVAGVDMRVDAVLQITSSIAYEATDPVLSVLNGNCSHVQGWRVHQSPIYDFSPAKPLGQRLPAHQTLWFNQRLDGMTREAYDYSWYLHAEHPDGQEAASDESRAILAAVAPHRQGNWYIQNRMREPITPTAWVVNGVSDWQTTQFMPSAGERYNPQDGMGEDPFDRWPPRLVQGYTYWVA